MLLVMVFTDRLYRSSHSDMLEAAGGTWGWAGLAGAFDFVPISHDKRSFLRTLEYLSYS